MSKDHLHQAATEFALKLSKVALPDIEGVPPFDEMVFPYIFHAFIAGARWERRRPDPLGEALNSGNGVYQP